MFYRCERWKVLANDPVKDGGEVGGVGLPMGQTCLAVGWDARDVIA